LIPHPSVVTITRQQFDAVFFDMDGVLTDTTRAHALSWKTIFDRFREKRISAYGESFPSFDEEQDYRFHMDGRLRHEGILSFLESRGIQLPLGDPSEPPNDDTICGLANSKDQMVLNALQKESALIYADSVDLARRLRDRGFQTAVVSSSNNCQRILQYMCIEHLFDARVDAETAAQFELAGKPSPEMYLYAANELRVTPERSVILEDAIAGVQAGRDGGFGLVIGVDRKSAGEELKSNGAHIVMTDLGKLKC
jgi:alpha,alpha-trehalase